MSDLTITYDPAVPQSALDTATYQLAFILDMMGNGSRGLDISEKGASGLQSILYAVRGTMERASAQMLEEHEERFARLGTPLPAAARRQAPNATTTAAAKGGAAPTPSLTEPRPQRRVRRAA